MRPHEALLTGIPRSGTTLACHLLNKVPNTVALHEPIVFGPMLTRPVPEICEAVASFLDSTRESILTRGIAWSRHVGGIVPDNHIPEMPEEKGLRRDRALHGEIRIDAELDPSFTLVVKHIMVFTALLKELSQRFRCYAMVRNPLHVLASWNSIDFDFRNGRAPAAEMLDPDLAGRLASAKDRIDRQLVLLDWFCARFVRELPAEQILRYEQLIESDGRRLDVVASGAANLNASLAPKPLRNVENREQLQLLARRLLDYDGAFWDLYSRSAVKNVMDSIC